MTLLTAISTSLKREFYLPIEIVEALGNAAVAVSELELSVDIVVSILSREPNRHAYCDPIDPFEKKTEFLTRVSHSQLLKYQWCRLLRKNAERSKLVHRQYRSAAMASVYSRGAGQLEQKLRQLAEKSGATPRLHALTPGRVNEIEQEAAHLALVFCQLGTSLLAAAKKLSIDLRR